MNLRMLALFAALVVVSPLSAREKSDVIVMKNGDKIMCEVKGLRSNTLHVSVDYILNTLSVDWTKVDHIESKQLFLIRTQDGTVYTGALLTPATPAGRQLQIEVVEAGERKVTLERKKIVTVDETSESFWQRWNGQLGAGFTYTKGNETSQYNLNSSAGYVEKRWVGAGYTSNLSSSSGASTSTTGHVWRRDWARHRKPGQHVLHSLRRVRVAAD